MKFSVLPEYPYIFNHFQFFLPVAMRLMPQGGNGFSQTFGPLLLGTVAHQTGPGISVQLCPAVQKLLEYGIVSLTKQNFSLVTECRTVVLYATFCQSIVQSLWMHWARCSKGKGMNPYSTVSGTCSPTLASFNHSSCFSASSIEKRFVPRIFVGSTRPFVDSIISAVGLNFSATYAGALSFSSIKSHLFRMITFANSTWSHSK